MADAKTEKQKVKEITDKLEEGLKELFESGKYKNYLSTMSKFHNYSVNNTLLIALQRPDASLVAGYQAWQKNFNRHVNKGEKPYVNTLSADELKTLREIYGQAEGAQKKILLQIIHKYGPDKLEL